MIIDVVPSVLWNNFCIFLRELPVLQVAFVKYQMRGLLWLKIFILQLVNIPVQN